MSNDWQISCALLLFWLEPMLNWRNLNFLLRQLTNPILITIFLWNWLFSWFKLSCLIKIRFCQTKKNGVWVTFTCQDLLTPHDVKSLNFYFFNTCNDINFNKQKKTNLILGIVNFYYWLRICLTIFEMLRNFLWIEKILRTFKMIMTQLMHINARLKLKR